MDIITSLLANKVVIGVLGSIIALIAIYFKGYKSGKTAVERADRDAADQLNHEVKSAEASNQKIEQERAKDSQAVNNADTISKLISVWDSLTKNGRGPTEPRK